MPGERSLHRARRRARRPATDGPRAASRRRAPTPALPVVRRPLAVDARRRRPGSAPVTERADLPPVAQADLDAVAAPARAAAPAASPGGPPLPVRPARRGADRPRLPDGTPFPTLVLPHLPAPHRCAVDRWRPGRDARDDRAPRDRRTCATRTPRRTTTTSSARCQLGEVPEIAGVSAGGMPDRVKCLHVLVAHALGRRARGQPARRRGARDARPVVAAAPVLGRRAARPASATSARRAGRRVSAASPRVAAIDCGTNSIRLLVADVDAGRHAHRRRPPDGDRAARPGRRPHRRHRPGGAGAHARRAPREYAAQCRELGVERVRFVATSRTRDAANRADFVAGVRDAFGARRRAGGRRGRRGGALSFARRDRRAAAHGIAGPYLVVDIGGGSTEFVLGTTDVEAARSVDVGCVRMTERHLHSDPPTADQVEAARADIAAALDARRARPSTSPAAARVVGLAGSVTTVAAQALGLPAYDPDADPPRAASRPTRHRAACRSCWR